MRRIGLGYGRRECLLWKVVRLPRGAGGRSCVTRLLVGRVMCRRIRTRCWGTLLLRLAPLLLLRLRTESLACGLLVCLALILLTMALVILIAL